MKDIVWVGTALDDLSAFPQGVKRVMGFAFRVAQAGEKHPDAKPLKGYRGAGVLELVDDFDGDTYRAVYTVRFSTGVYVLHAFQKKSKRGRETPKQEIELIEARLKRAQQLHEERRARA